MEERMRHAERVQKLRIVDEYPSEKLSLLFEVLPNRKVDDIRGLLNRPDGVTLPRLSILIYHLNSVDIPARQDRDKKPMFVDVVQNVYGPNGVIPSAIRAYLVKEEFTQVGAKFMDRGVFISRSLEPTFKFFELFSNGKLGALTKDGGNQPLSRFEPRIVQSAIEIVENISDHEGEVEERLRICELMYKSFCSELRVNLNSGGIGIMKRSDACFDIADVSIGPIDF